MAETLARDIMTQEIIAFAPDQSVTEAAKVLSKNRIGGAPVLNAEGGLIGVVSETDLIAQDVKLHFPTYIQLLDSYIYLGSLSKFEHLLRKAVGAQVKDIMTVDVVTVSPEASIEDVATIMTEQDISLIPVIKESRVIGVITKGDIVKSLGRD